jgi:tetratricopeptide (TPR) repeat protein
VPEQPLEGPSSSTTRSPAAVVTLAGIQVLRHELDEAIALCRQAQELNPKFLSPHAWLSHIYGMQGRHDDSIASMKRLLDANPQSLDLRAAMVPPLANAGRRDEARRLLGEVLGDARKCDAGILASAHAAVGEIDEAIACIERGIDENAWSVLSLKRHPRFDPVRSDPRFDGLLERLVLL